MKNVQTTTKRALVTSLFIAGTGKQDVIRILKCKTCGSYFSERRNTALYNCKLQEDKALKVIYQLSRGYSIRKINRLTGVSRDTISRLTHIAGQHSNSLHNKLIRHIKVRKAQFDKKRSYGAKKRGSSWSSFILLLLYPLRITTVLRAELAPKDTCIAAQQ